MLNIPFQVQNVAATYKFSTLPGVPMNLPGRWYFKRIDSHILSKAAVFRNRSIVMAATKSLMQITMSCHKRVTASVQRSTSPHLNQTNEEFLQEFFVQLVVIFLKSCQHFQALTWPCQARLLRKNIAEISLILTTMCFHREQQVFR